MKEQNFLIDVKDQVMRALGFDDFIKYYDFRWSEERLVTGIGGAAEYDICRMIVGIHKGKSIFLSDSDIRRNEKNKKYKQQLINETIEKIKMRSYGSVHFRAKTLFKGEEFNAMFKKRICQTTKAKADFLHFGWVDYIDGYHKVVKKSPYSVYGIISFLKDENRDENLGLDWLEDFYRSCHAYTHGSIQLARYLVLHYFEISFMLYLMIRKTFLLLCREKKTGVVIAEQDIISMIDRDFEVLYNQYQKRSTENFDKYYGLSS